MKYMLDTNECIDYMRGTSKGLKDRLLASDKDDLCISSITLSVLLYGVNKSSDPQRNRFALYMMLLKIKVLDYDTNASEHYGLIRSDLSKKGLVIGSLDMLIAAHAKSLGLTFVTHNTSEFSRISGLTLEDWYK